MDDRARHLEFGRPAPENLTAIPEKVFPLVLSRRGARMAAPFHFHE